jgi:REP element-mobilizing transposase RayT
MFFVCSSPPMELPVRKNPRASRYDYTSAGVYFVTVCTRDREEYFGRIIDKKMILNEIGNICEEEIHRMVQKRPSVDLHEYVIMPNHVHLLLCVGEWKTNNICRDGS